MSTTTVKFSASEAAAVDSALCVLEPTSFIVVVAAACLLACLLDSSSMRLRYGAMANAAVYDYHFPKVIYTHAMNLY